MQITQQEAKEANDILEEAKQQNENYIEILKSINCKLCLGWGHVILECSVFKSMEDFASSAPALHIAWGKHKSGALKADIEDASKHLIAGQRRKMKKRAQESAVMGSDESDDMEGVQ